MAINTHNFQAQELRRALVSLQSDFMRYAKFIVFEPSRNIGMCFGVHIGIDTNTHRCTHAKSEGHFAQDFQLCFAFHVEASDASTQCLLHFSACFTHARKNNLGWIAARSDHTC